MAAASQTVVPDTVFGDVQRQTLAEIGTKTGTDFDAAYAKAQADAN